MDGRWAGRWQHGQEYTYTFDAAGRFTSSGGAALPFEREKHGATVVRHPAAFNRHVNRFTPAGRDRLLLESWPSPEEYEAGKPPTDFGIARRVE